VNARIATVAALLTILLVLGLVADLALIRPIRDADHAIAALREDLANVERRASAANGRLAAARSVELPAMSVVRDDPSEVEARFQEQVRSTLNEFGGMTLSSQVVAADLGGGYRKISLLLRAQLSEDQLLSLLGQTREARPLIVVESLDARALPAPDDARYLDVTATLTMIHADDTAT
jgi:hypothetical protein